MERFRFLLLGCVVTAAVTGVVIACDPPAPTKAAPLDTRNAGDDDDKPKKKPLGDDDDDVPVVPVVGDAAGQADPTLADGGKPPGRVYAHTADNLYVFDPLIKQLKFIGPFDGLHQTHTNDERVLDIALDGTSAMYGTTDYGFIKIDPLTAKVQYIKENPDTAYFQFPNALTFVPTGTVDPTKEALVGYLKTTGKFGATTYVRVDLGTGTLTTIGELNPVGAALKWQSAGDIIAMTRNKTAFVTVKLLNTDDGGPVAADPGTDSLAEIDPATGQIKRIVGDVGQPNFYGLGQWAGTAYGFNAGGNIVEISLVTGAGKTVLSLKEDGGVAGSWFGAGVTTDAPTLP